jgi:hypothetical protein
MLLEGLDKMRIETLGKMIDTVGTVATGIFEEVTVSTIHISAPEMGYESYETVVFGGSGTEVGYNNKEEALKGHKKLCVKEFSAETLRYHCKFCGNMRVDNKTKCPDCGASYY